MEPLLQVRDLRVSFFSDSAPEIVALRGITFDIYPGECAAILGESGCGKTTAALSILRLLPPAGRFVSGSILFRRQELIGLSESKLQEIRGAAIAMIFQESGIALNPFCRVVDQVAEVLRARQPWTVGKCREEAEALLRRVHLKDDGRLAQAYPHQLSGGERQRVLIAQAIACRPALVLADEPTASLDTTVQADILQLLKELKKEQNMSVLLITHNPALLPGLVDRVLVMYAGRIIEEGALREVMRNPLHPYTRSLLASIPHPPELRHPRLEKRLAAILGAPPDPSVLPPGCAFAPRCQNRMEQCTSQTPQMEEVESAHRVECFLYAR